MDTKKLRQKILDLAIHGKLVPQDPNDEPASVLLERIRAEKEQLIKEGKIKAPKKSKTAGDTPHYGKEGPFELPKGWVWTTVKEVFLINPKNDADDDSYAGFVPMASISDGFSDSFVSERRLWKEIKSGFTHFADDDVAVAKISPCLENRKSFVVRNLPNGIGSGTTELFIFRCSHILTDYTLLFFKSDFFISTCVGTFNGVVGQQRVARSIIEDLTFPIPPLSEQKRIVKAVKVLFDKIDEIEKSKLKLNEYTQYAKSIILDLAIHGKLVPQDPNDEPAIELLKRINPSFKPSDNLHYEDCPSGWVKCEIKDIFDITMGQSPDGKSINKENGLEFHQGKIFFTDKYIRESNTYTSSPTKIASPNSILCCVRAPVGIFNITDRKICIGRGLCSLSPKEQNLDLEFWFYALSTLTNYYESNATGSTFKAISGDIIRNTVVLLPPTKEQKRIVTAIEQSFEMLNAIEDSCTIEK